MDHIIHEQAATITNAVEKTLVDNAYLVKAIASHLVLRLPNTIQFEDLYQAGMIGLLEAIRRYSETKGASFKTYASIRIRGAMIDEMRKLSWAPRSVRHNHKKIKSAINKVESRSRNSAYTDSVVEELNLTNQEYHQLRLSIQAIDVLEFDEFSDVVNDNEGQCDLNDILEQELTQNNLRKLLQELPTEEKLVISFYYSEKFKYKEISHILGFSEARISQYHHQAINRLKTMIEKML